MKLDLVRAFLFLSLLVLGGCAGSKSGEVVEEKNALGATECPGEASLYGQGLAGTQQKLYSASLLPGQELPVHGQLLIVQRAHHIQNAP